MLMRFGMGPQRQNGVARQRRWTALAEVDCGDGCGLPARRVSDGRRAVADVRQSLVVDELQVALVREEVKEWVLVGVI
jgi:hypothetical protein